MQIKDIMTRNVEVIHRDTLLKDAAKTMRTLNIGLLPVCDGEQLVGMLSDRDITIRSAAIGLEPRKTRAGEVMTTEVICCFEDQDIEEAVSLMEKKQVRRLPVLNRDKQLVGLVSLGDVAVRTGDRELAGKTVEQISAPAEPNR
jgi:CBS domain-containing protein